MNDVSRVESYGFEAEAFKAAGFDFLLEPSRSLVWMAGSFKGRYGGRVVGTLSMACLGSGKWCISLSSFTLCRTDPCLSLVSGFQLSVRILEGWFSSILLDLSYMSKAAFSLRSSRGWMLAWISQAAVGVDLIPPQMKRVAWFCTLSMGSLLVLEQMFCSTML